MTEREAFETWAKQPPREWDCDRYTDHEAWPGNYRHYQAQCAWEGWQAAKAQPAQPAQAGQVLITPETGNAPDQGASAITSESGKAGQALTVNDLWTSDTIMALNAELGLSIDQIAKFARAIEQAVLAKLVPQWIATADQMPPPDTWLLVTWGDGAVDKAHTFTKWKHASNPLGYLIQGHPGSHNDVTHWMHLPPPPGIGGEKGGA